MNSNSYNSRITSYVVLTCVVAASGGILFGYDLGISGGVTSMESFLLRFFPRVYSQMKGDAKTSNYCKFNSELLTLFTSSLYIAGLVASLFASNITRSFGRRISILTGGAVFLAGAAIGGAAVNVFMLILGRILLGFGIGFTNQSIPLYLSEMAAPHQRGTITSGFEVAVSVGILVANLVNYGVSHLHVTWGWRISLALAAVPSTLLTIGAFFLPETPNNIVQNSGNVEKAARVLQKIRGTPDVQQELDDIVSASAASKAIDHPFRNITQRKYRPQLTMAIMLSFFQQFTGINVINFYAPVMFRTIGLGESASLLSAVVTRVVALCCNIIAMILVDKVGRRKLFIVGGFQMFVTQIIIGVMLATKLKDHGAIETYMAYLVLIVICVYVAGFACSWAPLAWLVTSEIFPLEIRSAGQSITVAMNFFSTFLIGQTFLAMLCHLKSGTFFFFAGWLVIMTLFIYTMLPETKHIPIEQMDKVWKNHWFWKRYVIKENEEKEAQETNNI